MAENSKSEAKSKTSFFDGVKAEFQKISWPDKQSLVKQTTAVAVITAITAALIAVIDYFVQYGVNFLTSL